MLEALLGIELLAWLGLIVNWRAKRQREWLIHGTKQPKSFPLIDRRAKSIAGQTTKNQRFIASKLAWLVRQVSNTRAFEYFLLASINAQSKLRKKPRRKRIVRLVI